MKPSETKRNLPTRKRRFVAAALGAKTLENAAEAAGISRVTAWRYLRDPAVRAELAARQDGVLGHAARRLAGEMGAALDVLHREMHDPAGTPASRVSAARTVLAIGLRAAELVDLAARVAELERRIGDGC